MRARLGGLLLAAIAMITACGSTTQLKAGAPALSAPQLTTGLLTAADLGAGWTAAPDRPSTGTVSGCEPLASRLGHKPPPDGKTKVIVALQDEDSSAVVEGLVSDPRAQFQADVTSLQAALSTCKALSLALAAPDKLKLDLHLAAADFGAGITRRIDATTPIPFDGYVNVTQLGPRAALLFIYFDVDGAASPAAKTVFQKALDKAQASARS